MIKNLFLIRQITFFTVKFFLAVILHLVYISNPAAFLPVPARQVALSSAETSLLQTAQWEDVTPEIFDHTVLPDRFPEEEAELPLRGRLGADAGRRFGHRVGTDVLVQPGAHWRDSTSHQVWNIWGDQMFGRTSAGRSDVKIALKELSPPSRKRRNQTPEPPSGPRT